ncbi:V-type ATP synthase subunit E [Mobilitalea sibirica]|uniref:V-type ATP synthase subunit E n=1 Tax=Mobilitalea sibirica TaxID=1462919 RepID=A0A8J7L3D4_9FIRM|nr:V-type ATP synthase subunit E [Mobilitalea sibirica]MBH1942353.1 V-type ATP synthase subunit E [Mobilitalea sibirica]
MTGLEKILKAIEEDAKAAAAKVISEAEKEATEIMNEAKAQADKNSAEIARKSDADVKELLKRADSAAKLQEKKLILDAKQQNIGKVIESARTSLLNLPDKEYFDVIIRMVQKFALGGQSGEILFSSKDYKRIPKNFDTMIKEALTDKKGASLTVSKEVRSLDGGFVLVYGDIEENCSFDALFSAAKEDLQDKVNAFLYE